MKKLKTMDDLAYVIKYKLDLVDDRGYTFSFVRFMSLTLLEVVNAMNDGIYSYDLYQ